MPRAAADRSTYAARVAAALGRLRQNRGWSIEDLQASLAQNGHQAGSSTLYAYERGKAGGGVDLPLSAVPAIAAAYGYRTAHGWLPDE